MCVCANIFIQFYYLISITSPTGFDSPAVDDNNLTNGTDNPLLVYCYPMLYGPNYGVRSYIEFDNECIEGETCDDESTEIEDIDAAVFVESTDIVNRNKRG